ncbi:uncharacterized protein LOC132308765 [Cornus florida]|uniref:uncharacterized protein LOC132308765 n=1 Tax=Cornus florida TaxID=4283 RepID=UPI00289C84D2|nr:uncharacterized protein LOC132308765 [Cornus florida]
MQPQQKSRIDVAELKAQIVKKIGMERSRRYFYYLNRLLSQKLSKGEFDKLCFRLLGKENLPLHNQFIRSILKNACQAKTPPPIHVVGPTTSAVGAGKFSPAEDGHEQSDSVVLNHTPSIPVWSNGVVLPVSPRKGRSAIRDRKFKDRPSPLGPNKKADSVSHQSMATEDSGMKTVMANGSLTPHDHERLMQHPQGLAEQPDNGRSKIKKSTDSLLSLHVHSKDQSQVAVVEDGGAGEQSNHLNISRSPLIAPLGIPFCSASVGGAHKTLPVASTNNVVHYFDSGGLSDTETLKKCMEQIAAAQGLKGVSIECANMLNNMLDVYLKHLIRSCIELVGARSPETKKQPAQKQQIQGKLINGMWPSNHLHMHSVGPMEVLQDQRPRCSISLLDFKVAMELNPQQLGENWPLLLEKICMHAFEE